MSIGGYNMTHGAKFNSQAALMTANRLNNGLKTSPPMYNIHIQLLEEKIIP